MTGLKKSRFVVEVPVRTGGEELLAVLHTMTRAFILAPAADWATMSANPDSLTDQPTIDLLRASGYLLREEDDEAVVFDFWRQQFVHDYSNIKSKVLITRKCNNRCAYCIFELEPREMTSETAQTVDKLYLDLVKEKSPKSVEDEYSGGEPLLNLPLLIESASRRRDFCQRQGIEYKCRIVTNGTLLSPEIVSSLKDAGLTGLRVSLAGTAEVHDKLRPLKDGSPTFERILTNIGRISGILPLGIECQYDGGAMDYQALPEMMDEFKRRGLGIDDVNFTPIMARRNETRFTSGMGDASVYLWLVREAQKRGFQKALDIPTNACMADFRSRLTFDTDGSILGCSSMQSGETVYGSASTGVDFAAEAQMVRRKFADKCLEECNLLPVCLGGCRLQAIAHGRDFNGFDCQYEMLDIMLKEYIKDKVAEQMSGMPNK